MPVLKKCCCCCALRTGGVILGWLGLISSAFNVTGTSIMLENVHEWSNIRPDIYKGLSISLPYVLTAAVIMLLAYILLLIGSSTGNPFLLLPVLVLDMMSIVCNTLVVLIVGPIMIATNEALVALGIVLLAVGLPAIGLSLYWWLCVLSLFQELRQAKPIDGAALLPAAPSAFTAITQDYSPPPYARLVEKA